MWILKLYHDLEYMRERAGTLKKSGVTKINSEEIRFIYSYRQPPKPRDYTAEALAWFDKLDRRVKWAILLTAVWFAWLALFPMR